MPRSGLPRTFVRALAGRACKRLVVAAAARALCAPHSQPPPSTLNPKLCHERMPHLYTHKHAHDQCFLEEDIVSRTRFHTHTCASESTHKHTHTHAHTHKVGRLLQKEIRGVLHSYLLVMWLLNGHVCQGSVHGPHSHVVWYHYYYIYICLLCGSLTVICQGSVHGPHFHAVWYVFFFNSPLSTFPRAA